MKAKNFSLVRYDADDGKVFDSVDKYEKDLCLWMDPITMLSMATQV